MALTLGLNIATLTAQRGLRRADAELTTATERISSGQRINRSADDAASLAVESSLEAGRRVYRRGAQNINDGVSLLNIADSALEELSNIVSRIKELAQQSANGGLGRDQRAALDREAQALSDEYFRITKVTSFNKLALFDTTFSTGITFQGGYGVSGSIGGGLGGALSSGTFNSAVATSTGAGTAPATTAFGDINGDGHLDILTANSGTNSLGLLLGNGDGSFTATAAISKAYASVSAALGDINNDGKLDIIASNYSGGGLTTHLGNGNGTFQAAQALSSFGVINDQPGSLLVTDLDNDGNVDVIASDTSGRFNVNLGNGNGTFRLHYHNLGHSGALAGGDFNGDGRLDFAVTDFSNDRLSIILGNGDGTFGAATLLSVGDAPSAIVSDDFDGDGRIDLAVANRNEDTVTIHRGNGNGTFTGKSAGDTFTTNDDPLSLAVGDLDGDGDPDLITGNWGGQSATVLSNSGTGSFSGGGPLNSNAIAFATRVDSINLADLNGDGTLDAVASMRSNHTIALATARTTNGVQPLLQFSLRSQADALQAIAPLDRKLNQLLGQRGVVGALQSRLESATRTLAASTDTYAAARSRIVDADMATEVATLVSARILREAASAVLAQANIQPRLALSLL